MRLKVYSIILVFILGTTQILQAQYVLTGTVKDAVSGAPIDGAQIIVKETSSIETTHTAGRFEIKGLLQGQYTVVVFSYQYETLTVSVDIDGDTEMDFSLNELSQELSEVVISQKKDEIFGLKRLQPVEGTSIYAGKKTEVILLDNMVGNRATNNARQVYAQVVGLNIYESNDGGLQLSIGGRGLDPNRTSNFNTRQNGYDISADVLGYPESYYTPPVEGLEEIEVIRGAASLQYGTQFGGLLNFKMKQPVTDKKIELNTRQTVGSYGLFTSFNSLSGTIGKVSYYTYVNYKQGNGYRPNSDFNSFNYFGGVQYQISERTKVSFEYTYLYYLAQQAGGLTDEQFAKDPLFSNRERNWFGINWNLYSFKLEQKIGQRTDLSFTVFGLDADRKALGFRGIPGADGANRNPVSEPDWTDENGEYIYTRDLIIGEFNNWGAEIRLLSRYSLWQKDAVFLVGAKYYNAHNSSRQGPGIGGTGADFYFDLVDNPDYSGTSDYSFPNLNFAAFGENIFFLTDNLSITPGVRFEYIRTESHGAYWDATARTMISEDETLQRGFVLLGLGVSQSFDEGLELYGNISQNYRSVTFSDIRTVSPSFKIDPNIYDETGFTADVGFRGNWQNILSYDAGVYSLLYNDRIGIIFDDRANRVRTNIGDAIIYGVEMFVDVNLAKVTHIDAMQYKLNWFVNNAFTDSRYIDAVQGNNGVEGNKVEFIPFVNLKTGINAGYKNLLASVQFTYLTEQYTDAENSPVTEDTDDRAGVIGEIPSYHILDVSMSYSHKFLRFETGVTNLTNNSYFTRRATGYPGPGIIPSDGRGFYFTLGVKI
ncbi:TonB-dependent receptor [Reichenbachiella sp. 5M10]|uniref:TonB-dependent receptor n=1 Tax=Reichenbachiella sp. 5M10 TaxID=1889772 RepID=UPI000C144F52|nr:TonB-dependent receptor [Reichenbachiella sp. 5M10]PIB35323.1 TonB-dependent receptor [Reichenbachiella sp. 5M10]